MIILRRRDNGCPRNWKKLMGKILTADRAALSITGDGNESDAEALLGFLRKGKMGEREVYQPRERGKEILEIPAAVGFAGKGGNLVTLGETFRGSLHVASRLLSYGYLWNDIRVQGGAYGTKLQVFPDGDILFTTYRDPNPAALPRFLRWCSPGSERFLRQRSVRR